MSSIEHTSFSSHARSLIRVSLPLALSQVSETAMGVTDTILLGGLSASAMAIGGLANNVFITTMVVFQCLLSGGGILLSQTRGAKDHGHDVLHDGPSVMNATFVLSLLAFIPCFIILFNAGSFFGAIGEPSDVVHTGHHFIRILLLSLLPDLALIGVLRVALPALGAESMLLWIMPSMAVCNGFLNAALIYGLFGFPKLGMWGSAWATTLTSWAVGIALFLLSLRRPALREVMRPAAIHLSVLKKLVQLGFPIMLSAASEILLFQFVTLLAGKCGTHNLAAHQVALQSVSLLFMVCLAIGQATNVRVAYWRGAKRLHEAKRSAMTALGLVVIWTMLTGILFFGFPEYVAKLYYTGKPPSADTFATTILLLRIAGIFQLVDGLQTVCGGALRGCGDVWAPMIIGVCSYMIVGLGFGSWLAFYQNLSVEGLWIGLAAGLAVSSLGLGTRLYWLFKKQDKIALG